MERKLFVLLTSILFIFTVVLIVGSSTSLLLFVCPTNNNPSFMYDNPNVRWIKRGLMDELIIEFYNNVSMIPSGNYTAIQTFSRTRFNLTNPEYKNIVYYVRSYALTKIYPCYGYFREYYLS